MEGRHEAGDRKDRCIIIQESRYTEEKGSEVKEGKGREGKGREGKGSERRQLLSCNHSGTP